MAIEIYSRQAQNIEDERRAIEIRIRAERRCGELLAESEKAKPENAVQRSRGTTDARTLADLGISKGQSSGWQKLAKVPPDEFEVTFNGADKPSTNGIIKTQEPRKNAVDDNALWLWGRLHHGLLH